VSSVAKKRFRMIVFIARSAVRLRSRYAPLKRRQPIGIDLIAIDWRPFATRNGRHALSRAVIAVR
jgi:hypothetical protein